MKISAKTKDNPTPVEVEVEIPDSLSALVSKFGEAVVFNRAKAALVIDAQARVRRLIEKNADPKTKEKVDIQKEMGSWKPDVRSGGPRVSAAEKLSKAVDTMSAEEKQALLAKLTGGKPAKQPAKV